MLAVLFFSGTFGAIFYSAQVPQTLRFGLGHDAPQTCLRLLPLADVRLLPLAGAVFVGAALTGRLLPSAPLDTARHSVGGGLAVAQRIREGPSAGPRQAQALVEADDQAFAHGVARTRCRPDTVSPGPAWSAGSCWRCARPLRRGRAPGAGVGSGRRRRGAGRTGHAEESLSDVRCIAAPPPRRTTRRTGAPGQTRSGRG
ncbi:hypothetical protein [Streptomyces phaeoluteigriseus]|uniref:hypothetical protein n=1 Tax=Streptomyces phaeoluteigriseus TaxID=114686 RepID=UPI003EBC9CF1